jgi:hypothetical protein
VLSTDKTCGAWRSILLPIWVIPFNKLTQSFVGDWAAERSVKAFGFSPKSLRERQPKSSSCSLFVSSNRWLWQGSYYIAKFDSALQRTALRHNLAHEANPVCFLSVDDPTSDDHFHGSSKPDDSRETLRSAICQTNIPAPTSYAKGCVLFCNSDIRKARPFKAAGIGYTVHRRDDRLVDIGPSAWTERPGPFATVVGCNLGWRKLRASTHRFEIAARAKSLVAGSG